MTILTPVNISCHTHLPVGTCWGYFTWNRPFETLVLLSICMCLASEFREVLWWQTAQFSEEGLWKCCKCKLPPSLGSGSVTGSRLLTISQLPLATQNLCFLQKSLCSEQAGHLTVVRRLCVCWIFYLPSGWQQSTEHTSGLTVPQTIIYEPWKGHLLLLAGTNNPLHRSCATSEVLEKRVLCCAADERAFCPFIQAPGSPQAFS